MHCSAQVLIGLSVHACVVWCVWVWCVRRCVPQCHTGCGAVHRNSDDALEARGAWCPSEESWSARREQWLELDLGATRVVHALRVRGDQQYVRSPFPPTDYIHGKACLLCHAMPCRASPHRRARWKNSTSRTHASPLPLRANGLGFISPTWYEYNVLCVAN